MSNLIQALASSQATKPVGHSLIFTAEDQLPNPLSPQVKNQRITGRDSLQKIFKVENQLWGRKLAEVTENFDFSDPKYTRRTVISTGWSLSALVFSGQDKPQTTVRPSAFRFMLRSTVMETIRIYKTMHPAGRWFVEQAGLYDGNVLAAQGINLPETDNHVYLVFTLIDLSGVPEPMFLDGMPVDASHPISIAARRDEANAERLESSMASAVAAAVSQVMDRVSPVVSTEVDMAAAVVAAIKSLGTDGIKALLVDAEDKAPSEVKPTKPPVKGAKVLDGLPD